MSCDERWTLMLKVEEGVREQRGHGMIIIVIM